MLPIKIWVLDLWVKVSSVERPKNQLIYSSLSVRSTERPYCLAEVGKSDTASKYKAISSFMFLMRLPCGTFGIHALKMVCVMANAWLNKKKVHPSMRCTFGVISGYSDYFTSTFCERPLTFTI